MGFVLFILLLLAGVVVGLVAGAILAGIICVLYDKFETPVAFNWFICLLVGLAGVWTSIGLLHGHMLVAGLVASAVCFITTVLVCKSS